LNIFLASWKKAYKEAAKTAAGFSPLLVAAERVASTVSQGIHGRRRLGQGDAFWQFRHYHNGDSISSIDWRQSARTDSVFVREKEWKAAQSIWLWGDRSLSMQYSSSDKLPTKQERADLLTLALASLLNRAGERIARLGAGLEPESGRAALIKMCAVLENRKETGENVPVFEFLPRHAHVVLISDFLSDLKNIKLTIRAFSRIGVIGHLLQVVDPAEENLPFKGRVEFEGLEEGEGTALVLDVEDIKEQYLKRLQAHRRALSSICKRARWTFNVHCTDSGAERGLAMLCSSLGNLGNLR